MFTVDGAKSGFRVCVSAQSSAAPPRFNETISNVCSQSEAGPKTRPFDFSPRRTESVRRTLPYVLYHPCLHSGKTAKLYPLGRNNVAEFPVPRQTNWRQKTKMKNKFAIFLLLALTSAFCGSQASAGVLFSVRIAPPADRGLRSTALSWRRVHLDAWLLSIRRLRLLLGAGPGSFLPARDSSGRPVIGVSRRQLRVARRVLGSASRLLRRHQLRQWLPGFRLHRRTLGRRRVPA